MLTWTTPCTLSARPHILFDFDGTLADTKPTIIKVATKVLRDWGIPEGELPRVEELIGPPFPDAFTQVFGVSAEDAAEITRRYREIYFSLCREAWPLFDGVDGLLAELRDAGRKTAVASSKIQSAIEKNVADNEATHLFDAMVGRQAPDVLTKADAIAEAMEALGASPHDSIMVGDRYHDVEGATEVGIPCIGVLWGATATREELVEAGAVVTLDTLDELRAVLLGS